MSDISPALDLAWKVAAGEAGSQGHAQITPAHLLIGLLSLEKALGVPAVEAELGAAALAIIRSERAALAEILAGLGLEASDLRRALRQRVGGGPGRSPGPISRSAASKAAFARAVALADGAPASGLHLLAALLEARDEAMRDVLADRRVSVEALLKRVRVFTGVRADVPDALAPAAQVQLAADKAQARDARPGAAPDEGPPSDAGSSRTPTLDRYSRDLTRLAAQGELGPLVGRRNELLQVLQTLARSNKNNPVLVGEAGVGKTAIVEGLAIRAAAGKDAAVLGGKRIVELNLGALLGGTDYRGEFEKRVTRILDEARTEPGLILFIDEIHTVVGAGRVSSGGTDAANLLKPALARGDLTVIGATTIDEYRRYIEKDPALERRFEKIEIVEPALDETREILWGLRRKWEAHHGVAVDDAALDAAVALSVRFDTDHRLPDKAVDLVDKAAARARVPSLSMLAPGAASAASAASSANALQAAAGEPADRVRVGARLVAEVLAEKRSLDLDLVLAELGERAGARVLGVEAFLKTRLVGQDEAIARVASRLRIAQAGLTERRGPRAVFLLLGPTGVGKTELARSLAEALFARGDELIRFDMSEYMEEHAVAKLLGAPPGYVGYEAEGLLVARLRSQPHAVVLLDEVEKAHPRLFDVFLQVFDEGRVTGAQGRVVDARHAIFVMTSNLGASTLKPPIGFGEPPPSAMDDGEQIERAALEAARGFFRAELLNRIDDVIVLRRLGATDARAIVERSLAALTATLRARQRVAIEIAPDAVDCIAAAGFSAQFGAREVQRVIERLVAAPLAQLVLAGDLARHPQWRLTRAGDEIRIAPIG